MVWIKKIDKKVGLLILGLLIAGLMCLGAALNFRENRGGTLEGMEWQKTADGKYEIQCFQLGMKAGEYTLSVSYDAGKNLSYRVVDMQRNSGENELGKEINSGKFSPGKNDATIDLKLEEDAGKLALYLESDSADEGTGWWNLETQSGAAPDFVLMFLCIAAGLLFLYRFRNWERYSGLIIAVTTAVIITAPFFTGYQQTGDDMDFHMARIRGIAGALSTGQFPVRLNTDFAWGYGFSSSMMYPELFLYIPAVLYMLGVSLITAYKFLILCINIATACVGLYSFKRLLGSDKLGLIVALLYLTNPYRLVNIFHRAALGEILAQIFLPLLMYGVYELIFGNAKKWWVTVLAASGIIQSHILSVEMSLFFVLLAFVVGIIYMIKHDFKMRMIEIVKATITIIGLNLWFLLPFLDHFGDGSMIQAQETNLQGSSLDIWTLFRISMKLQGSYQDAGVTREEFVSVGAVVLLGSLVYLYYAFVRRSVEKKLRNIGTVCLCLGTVCCYMATRAFPWMFIKEHMKMLYKILGTVQFSWRFLAYASLFLSVTTGIAIMELMKEKKEALTAVLAGLAVFMTFSCMDQYTRGTIFISSRSEIKNYGWTWFDYYAADADAWEIMAQGDTIKTSTDISITSYERKGVGLSFDYSGVDTPCKLRLPVYDYGLYEVYRDGEQIDTVGAENHQVTLMLTEDKSSGHIEVKYVERLLYKVGNAVSLLTAIAFAAFGVMRRRNGKRKDITGNSVL